jgi:hypothetical protein
MFSTTTIAAAAVAAAPVPDVKDNVNENYKNTTS